MGEKEEAVESRVTTATALHSTARLFQSILYFRDVTVMSGSWILCLLFVLAEDRGEMKGKWQRAAFYHDTSRHKFILS